MRDIKFRAWDLEHEDYIKAGFDFRVDGNGRVYLRVWGESMWDRTSTLILEQFTGLLDKNGKEIYEGDKWKPKNKDLIETIVWDDFLAQFVAKGEDGRSYSIDAHDAKQHEIIGNIHEHKHLLEKETK